MIEKLKTGLLYIGILLAGLAFGWLIYQSGATDGIEPSCLVVHCIRIIK